MTQIKSICLVCRGKREVVDKKTALLRPCVGCKGEGYIYVKVVSIKEEDEVELLPTKIVAAKPDNIISQRIEKAIREFQKDYLNSGDLMDLRPMRLKDISEVLGVNVSTVCIRMRDIRGINGYPVKSLFSTSVDSLSNTAIMEALKKLVAAENVYKPYSDVAIVREMKSRHNITLGRRTVTKYREILGILAWYRREMP